MIGNRVIKKELMKSDPEQYIVLSDVGVEGHSNYVTHGCRVDNFPKGTYLGHYFGNDLVKAAGDFTERVEG